MSITCAHLPRDIYQRRNRYWPESRQKPYLDQRGQDDYFDMVEAEDTEFAQVGGIFRGHGRAPCSNPPGRRCLRQGGDAQVPCGHLQQAANTRGQIGRVLIADYGNDFMCHVASPV